MRNTEFKIKELRDKILKWDVLALDNPNNVHNLSTSERTEWEKELNELKSKWVDNLLDSAFN